MSGLSLFGAVPTWDDSVACQGFDLSRGLALLLPALIVACGPMTFAPSAASQGSSLATCDAAFRQWVGLAASLNSPGVDFGDQLVRGEAFQRRVFELCSLEEAERLNREVPIEYVPGRPQPMIEPDFRTFAEVECVDEAPLLDGTPLCAEVGR